MRRLFFASLLAAAAIAADANRASAWWWCPPQPATVAFPMVYPAGWYTNTYTFAWYYPWYANYNYSHGSFANWYQWHGWAFYGGQPIPHNFRIDATGAYMLKPPQPQKKDESKKKDEPKKKEPGKVTIDLPPDAKLLFNGVAATGSGDTRTYQTPDLEADRDYEYVLIVEVTRDGRTLTATERVVVRAGSVSRVSLAPSSVAAK